MHGLEYLWRSECMFVCKIFLCVCDVLEQRSNCAKWPVTEVFHVNPMIHTEPPRHSAHTCSKCRLPTDAILRPTRAYAHSYTRTPKILWFSILSMHTIHCVWYVLRRVVRYDYYFVSPLRCFVLLVQKVKADSKQTNKQQTWKRLIVPASLPAINTWLVNPRWQDKPE